MQSLIKRINILLKYQKNTASSIPFHHVESRLKGNQETGFYITDAMTFTSECMYRTFTTGELRKVDPTARRPNKKCDPYGLNGKPLTDNEAESQLTHLDPGWMLSGDSDNGEEKGDGWTPKYLKKEFYHLTYLDGSTFISKLAAVAHLNNHYFTMKLERRLLKREKNWRIVSTILCNTEILGGLSYHDFHIAMLIDIEVARFDVNALIVPASQCLKKQH